MSQFRLVHLLVTIGVTALAIAAATGHFGEQVRMLTRMVLFMSLYAAAHVVCVVLPIILFAAVSDFMCTLCNKKRQTGSK